MKNVLKWTGIVFGGAVVVALAVGFVAFKFTTNARASTPTFQNNTIADMSFRGGPGFPGVGGNGEQALADALGIKLADLQTAEQKANDAAIQQAVTDGLISQDQADEMILRGGRFGFGFEGRGPFGFKDKNNTSSTIDYNALLAQALTTTLSPGFRFPIAAAITRMDLSRYSFSYTPVTLCPGLASDSRNFAFLE